MHILLVQPAVNAEPAYPLALAAMIPLLEGAGHTVEGIDLMFDDEKHLQERIESGQIDWVGATVLHHNSESVARWMRPLRSHPTIQTFVAGALPTLNPTSALAHTGAHFAVVGPPEETVADLVDARDPHDVEGVVHANRAVPIPRFHTPLMLLPLPDRKVFHVERYSYAMRSMATPYAQVYTSRGCIHACPYCPVPALRPDGFDARLPEQVVEEWSLLVHEHGIKSIHVEDDNFMEDPQRVRDICEHLQASNQTFQWELVNGIRVDQVDAHLLERMAQAGCTRIVFSFEHLSDWGSPAVGYKLQTAKQAIRDARSLGMRVGGYFVVGLPGITAQQTLSSIRMGLQLQLDDANWVPFYETPGTLPSLARKAVELIHAGGPVPMRDTP